MDLDMLTQPVVRLAIEALQQGNEIIWLEQFVPDATLTDDGLPANFHKFSEHAMGHERFTRIDRVENQGWTSTAPSTATAGATSTPVSSSASTPTARSVNWT